MEWLQILGPTVLVIIGGIISWILKNRADEYRTIKEKLNQEEREIYKKMLNPYIEILAKQTEKSGSDNQPNISPSELRTTLFELNLIGSDNVIRAYNRILQNAYQNERTGKNDPKQKVLLFGNLLLEIRKSLGHKNTKLKPKDMFEGMIKDIDQYL
jgi:hypothetical protein